MNGECIPVIIPSADRTLFGVLRANDSCRRAVIMLPAETGTRVGPQNLYTTIATSLLERDIASCCFDLPPAGDSFTIGSRPPEYAGEFHRALDLIVSWLNDTRHYQEHVLLTISAGCAEALRYALHSAIERLVLLSPNNTIRPARPVSTRALRQYLYKMGLKETWTKAVTFRLHWRQIFRSVITPLRGSGPTLLDDRSRRLKILCLYGERDEWLNAYRAFWAYSAQCHERWRIDEHVVSNSDHSFMSWKSKEEVAQVIARWLNRGCYE